MQDGDHSEATRLARKIQEPLVHLVQGRGEEIKQKSEQCFLEIAKLAVCIGFQLEFAVSTVECIWNDPFTRQSRGFPLRISPRRRELMKTMFHQTITPLDDSQCEGRTVDMIGRPLIRWFTAAHVEVGNGLPFFSPSPSRETSGSLPLIAMISEDE